MATKKPMKRAKRYDEGGDVDESTAKQRGLDISNKEEPVGFFERIRMGNIDQPGTEAYNRFGAGRGRAAAPTPVVPRPQATPAAPSRPLSDDMYSDTGPSTGRGSAGTSETMQATPRPVTARPVATAPAKPVPEATVPPLIDRSKPVGTGNQRGPTAEELADYAAKKNPPKPKMDVQEMNQKAQKALSDDPTALLGAGAAGLGLYKLAKYMKGAKKAKDASPYLKELTMEPKKLSRSASNVTDVVAKKKGGAVKKYAAGGAVSSASKRADGIASRGKTRCKIC